MSARPTHFLCIPLLCPSSTPQLSSSLRSFIDTISQPPHANLDGSPFLPAEAIRPLGTLHLTLGVMHLPSQPALDAAISLLRSLDVKAIARQALTATTGATAESPLTITLAGLNALPTPKTASVLYAKPTEQSALLPFASAIRQQFIDAGFMKFEYTNNAARQRVPRPLLLHATVANTLYAPKPRGGGAASASRSARGGRSGKGGGDKQKVTVDTTELLYAFNEPTPFVWAENIPIDRVCICEMGAKPLADDVHGLGHAYRVVEERLLTGEEEEISFR